MWPRLLSLRQLGNIGSSSLASGMLKSLSPLGWKKICAISTQNESATTLSWPEFFRQRRRLQILKRIGGVPFIFAFWLAEGAVLSLPIFDPTRTIFDMDPLVVVAIASLAGTLGSYFAGSALIGFLWRLFRTRQAALLDQKQRNFYARITKYRANVPPNPTQMNFNVDFYGEKIRSLGDYRSWLRRQRKMISERSFKV